MGDLSLNSKVKKTYAFAFVLIFIEQFIKVIINKNYFDSVFDILPPYLYFDPMFNRDYSWFNSMFKWGVGKYSHIILVVVILAVVVLFYTFLNKQYGSHRLINIMYAFILAGAVCSLIDKVYWDGSLDYIRVNGYFTFDLKDVYINVFNALLVYGVIFKSDVIDSVDDTIMGDFKSFLLRK